MNKIVLFLLATVITIGGLYGNGNAASSTFTTGAYHPIIIDGELMGGTKDGQWFSAAGFWMKYNGKHFTRDSVPTSKYGVPYDISFALAKGGESYKLYSWNQYVATVSGGKPTYTTEGAGNEYFEVEMTSGGKSFDVAISGKWNALPRIPKKVKGQEAYAVDMDGDGKQDIIRIEALKTKEVSTKRIVVEMKGKKIQVADLEIDGVYSSQYSATTMDLNGDGKLEIITNTQGHNRSTSVYELSSGKAKQVLHFYAGD